VTPFHGKHFGGAHVGAIDVALPDRRATKRFGSALAAVLRPGDLVLLEGDLGSGKTFLARAVARALGVPSSVPVTSPTFALVHELEGRQPIIHSDLYRLDASADLAEIGLLDRRVRDSIMLVEWGARFASVLGGSGLRVDLALVDGARSARVAPFGEHGAERLRALAGV